MRRHRTITATMVGIMAFAIAGACVPAAETGASMHTNATPAWHDRIVGSHGAYDQLGGMAVDALRARVYTVATSDGAFVVAADDGVTGARRWTTHSFGPDGAQIFADAVALSSDGRRLFVSGELELSVDTRRTWTVAYDTANGSVQWAATLSVGPHREAIPRRIATSPDGTAIFVTGSRTGTHGGNDYWDYFTVRYAAETGAEVWRRTYDGPAHGGDTAEGLGVSADGHHIDVTGTSWGGATDRDIVTVAYDATSGTREWVARSDLGADDFATDLTVAPGGNRVYVAGFGRASVDAPHAFRVVAYDGATGAQIAAATYGDQRDDYAHDLAISRDGQRLFVTGTDARDYVTVAFPASLRGTLWAVRYDGGHGIDTANAVSVSDDGGRVYVTGESQDAGIACFGDVHSTAFATVSYATRDGAVQWIARDVGERKDPDAGLAVATGRHGRTVFVAGDTDFECRGSDVTTIAYTS